MIFLPVAIADFTVNEKVKVKVHIDCYFTYYVSEYDDINYSTIKYYHNSVCNYNIIFTINLIYDKQKVAIIDILVSK